MQMWKNISLHYRCRKIKFLEFKKHCLAKENRMNNVRGRDTARSILGGIWWCILGGILWYILGALSCAKLPKMSKEM